MGTREAPRVMERVSEPSHYPHGGSGGASAIDGDAAAFAAAAVVGFIDICA